MYVYFTFFNVCFLLHKNSHLHLVTPDISVIHSILNSNTGLVCWHFHQVQF